MKSLALSHGLLAALVAGMTLAAAPAAAQPAAPSSAAVADRWAVVVGITEYKHKEWNLKYAHRDAQQLAELLQKPEGGAFAKDHILLLTNGDATTANITSALRTFLKKPAENDVALLY